MATAKKKAVTKKKAAAIPDTDAFKPPAELVVKIPAGTRDSLTFRIVFDPRGILQHSCRGMIADEMVKMKEEVEHRKNPGIAKAKKEKIIRLPEETAELGSYPTNDGRFYHPAAAFLGSLIDGLWAAKAEFPGTKELACNVLQKSIRMEHEQAILVHPDTNKPFTWKASDKEKLKNPPYHMDFRTAVNLNTGGRILTFRPLWRKCATFITVSFDAAQIQPSVVEQALRLGGELVGVGAFRPLPPRNLPKKGKGGPFGTYTSSIWTKDIPKGAVPEL